MCVAQEAATGIKLAVGTNRGSQVARGAPRKLCARGRGLPTAVSGARVSFFALRGIFLI